MFQLQCFDFSFIIITDQANRQYQNLNIGPHFLNQFGYQILNYVNLLIRPTEIFKSVIAI